MTPSLIPTLRILSNKKQNYGPRDLVIQLRWEDGIFRRDSGALSNMSKGAQERRCEFTFMRLLHKFEGQGRSANASGGGNYAPSRFEEADGAFKKKKYAEAMNRLLENGNICHIRDGRSTRLVLTETGMAEVTAHQQTDIPF